jgi:hypothetical protein
MFRFNLRVQWLSRATKREAGSRSRRQLPLLLKGQEQVLFKLRDVFLLTPTSTILVQRLARLTRLPWFRYYHVG